MGKQAGSSTDTINYQQPGAVNPPAKFGDNATFRPKPITPPMSPIGNPAIPRAPLPSSSMMTGVPPTSMGQGNWSPQGMNSIAPMQMPMQMQGGAGPMQGGGIQNNPNMSNSMGPSPEVIQQILQNMMSKQQFDQQAGNQPPAWYQPSANPNPYQDQVLGSPSIAPTNPVSFLQAMDNRSIPNGSGAGVPNSFGGGNNAFVPSMPRKTKSFFNSEGE